VCCSRDVATLLITFQVAERALYFWNNEYFCNLVSDNVEIILPIMFPPLYENSKDHWNRYVVHPLWSMSKSTANISHRTIHSMVYNAMKMFMEINPQLFDECSHEYNERVNSAEEREQARLSRWDKLEGLAKDRKNGVAPPPRAPAANAPAQVDELEEITDDNQQRLNSLTLQDDSGSSKERRVRESTPTSVSPAHF
jgi:serine/threonine-protein phosphatase 2A regulatory subunit B'